MVQDTEMQRLNEGHHDEHSDDEGGSKMSGLSAICMCCCFVGVVAAMYFVTPDLSCGSATGLQWNGVIPQMTTSRVPTEMRWFRNDVDVFNKQSNGTAMGRWTSVKPWFGPKAYVFSTYDNGTGTEQVVLRADVPLEWFNWDASKDFELYLCSDSSQKYSVKEDVASQPWIELGTKTRNYDVFNPAGVHIADSTHINKDLISLGEAHWTIEIKSPEGQALATIEQETFMETAWFQHQSYTASNYEPLIIPNEVVSFLSAVFDLIKQDKDDEKSSSAGHSHVRR